MSTQIPVRRPSRIARPINDENAPSRAGVFSRMSKPTVLGDKPMTKPVAKDAAPLKPTVASVRPRAALSTQQQENTNIIAGKRKRDALADTANAKLKVDAPSKPSVTVSRSTTSSLQRASSTSKSAASGTATAARTRAPLGVKPKNIDSSTTTSVTDKAKQSDTESAVSSATNTRIIRRPGSVKRTVPPTATTATTTTVPAKPSVTVSRKVTQTVREETKTKVVDGHKARIERIRATTKVEKVAVREDVDEDELRSHKRPRLSEEREVPEAKELAAVTVEKVQQVLTKVVRKVEDEQPDDLDKEDEGDPLMVSEYVVEIFQYLRALEKTTMPNPRYMEYQKGLKPHMRGILGDWLIGIHRSIRMVPETLFIAMNLVDRFLSVRAISIEKVQLVGVVCLLIASKYEEICAPTISMMLRYSAKGSDAEEIKEAEKYVLKSLKYNLSYSSPITFLRRVSKADNFDAESRTLAKYLVELYCVDYELVQFPPSCISAAAMWLARLALDRGEWTANLAHYAGYKEAELLPCANVMLNYILKYPQHSAIFEKYASRKFNKASIYMRSWALARWDEGCDVDLGECLEALMEDSRLRVLAGRGGIVELIEGPKFGGEEAH